MRNVSIILCSGTFTKRFLRTFSNAKNSYNLIWLIWFDYRRVDYLIFVIVKQCFLMKNQNCRLAQKFCLKGFLLKRAEKEVRTAPLKEHCCKSDNRRTIKCEKPFTLKKTRIKKRSAQIECNSNIFALRLNQSLPNYAAGNEEKVRTNVSYGIPCWFEARKVEWIIMRNAYKNPLHRNIHESVGLMKTNIELMDD